MCGETNKFMASMVAEATYGCRTRPAEFLHHTPTSKERLLDQQRMAQAPTIAQEIVDVTGKGAVSIPQQKSTIFFGRSTEHMGFGLTIFGSL